jgi:Dyp-type peroxidase family
MKLLNQNDFSNDDLFKQLQGNILKGHGRDHTANVFVKFNKKSNKGVIKWISKFAKEKITSCKKQLEENELYKRNKISGDVFFSFLLSAEGYKFLNLDIESFEDSFLNGMKKADLNDPNPKKWEKGFSDPKNPIHAMIIIADDNPEKLGIATRELINELDKFSKILSIEYGNTIRNENGDGLEHFGYVDGISQPLFFEDEIIMFKQHNVDVNHFNPQAQKELVLIPDPLCENKDAYGSYFVFRKLEQNVRKFKIAEESLAKNQLQLQPESFERAGAMLVGRFEDGTPVQISEFDGMINSGVFNNFNYNAEDLNSKCPYHAHIRKTNPRFKETQKHIMARRGIPYGHREVPTTIEQIHHQMPENGVGLLFMSYQASIANQFETIQKRANATDGEFNLDPIIGQNTNNSVSTGQFATIYGDTDSLTNGTINAFVTMKGGEYLFAPSLSFLKNLK